MHMADALLSPAVGGTMWAVSATTLAYACSKVKNELDDSKIPLMGVLGAFVFAAQMINFTIPGTGSSGHLGGALLLAVVLGPHAAFLGIASVLTVQALFFADGGLLALGCNIFNLGFFPCYMAYPLIYKTLVKSGAGSSRRRTLAAVLAAISGLQLGALAVVAETTASGISSLPFFSFAGIMLPIHLAIGLVEGLVTAGVVTFILNARPEIINHKGVQVRAATAATPSAARHGLLVTLALAAILTGSVLAWFASEHPDGLEWSIMQVTGSEEVAAPEQGLHGSLAGLQQLTSIFPDYSIANDGEWIESGAGNESGWGRADAGTSIAGFAGGFLTMALIVLLGFLMKRRNSGCSAPA